MEEQVEAPPLTLDTVFEAVKRVRNWRELAKELMNWYEWRGEDQKKLDDIERQHASNKARLKAVVEEFLLGEAPLWRSVIHALHKAEESDLAEKIKTNAEPHHDPTMTVDNVSQILNKIQRDKWQRVMDELGIPGSLLGEIRRKYSTDTEKDHACADYYVNFHPDASWKHLTVELYHKKQFDLAKESKSFMSTDPTLTVDNVSCIMEKVDLKLRMRIWESACATGMEKDKMNELCMFGKEDECAHVYVHCNPFSSWELLAKSLYRRHQLAAVEEVRSYLPPRDPTLTVVNVRHVMEKVEPKVKMQVWEGACAPGMEADMMKEVYLSGKEDECADLYVRYNLSCSWELLAKSLYRHHQLAAVEEVRLYLPPRDLTITTEKLMELFAPMDPGKVDDLGRYLDLPQSEIDRIQNDYQSPNQKKEAYLDLYVHQHPYPTWSQITRVLRWKVMLLQQADLVENAYIKVSEKIQQCFDAAMMEGEVSLRNGSALLLGVGGSGKTHLLAAFLKEAPPSIRESTPCAKKPVRAVAHCKAGVSDDHFVRITNDHYSDMLVVTAENLSPPTNSVATAKHSVKPEAKDDLNSLASSSSSNWKETTRQSTAAKIDASQREETWSVHRAMKRQYLSRMQAGARKKSDLNDKDLLDVDDTGGQPMFHEVLPVFIQNTMIGMLTVKLNESLDSFPTVEFYTRGERIGEPFNSPFTHLDTLHHCMRVIRSTCDRDMCPKIAFVGTHKDREDECPQESREMKEEKLRSIIPQEMEDNIIVHGESLLLAVNIKTPGREEEKVISILREKAITELRKLKPKKIPLRYIPLEMAFQRMANEQRKSVMSKEECFEVAATYNFTRESFEAALKYLHGLKLVFYYEEVLPNVVFIDAQVILDKITELVVHSLSLQAKSKSKLLGALKKFVKHGIVTAEILEQFSSHYVPKLFMKEQLISLFEHLRIMAEVRKGEYLMPCLLRKQSIPCLVVGASSLVIPALLFFFGRDGPKLGVYCFLLASLITEAKWELLEEDGYPVQVSRNSAQFIVPGKNPGCITLIDSFSSYFHISIDFPASVSQERAQEICKDVCPTIRETVLTGIRKASQRLNYHDSIPSIAFPCSGHKNMSLHPATISDSGKLLTCTTHPATVCSEMTEQHRLWLRTANASPSPRNPALQGATASGPECVKVQQAELTLIKWKDDQGQIQRFYLMENIAYKWRTLGELLGLPRSKLQSLAAEHRDKPEECCRDVLGQWLDNPPPDYPITWQGLLELLEDSQLGQVVTELRNVLDKAKLW